MARLNRKLQVTWAELKALAVKKRTGLHSFETANATEIYIIEDGEASFWTAVFKDNDSRYVEEDRTDWETNYAANANGPTKPRSYDGRDKLQPVTLDYGEWHYWHSVGDSAEELRAGVRFKLERSTDGDEVAVWQYRDPIRLAGGHAFHKDASFGDYIDFVVFAPATEVVPNENNTGNCNVVFGNVIVPAAGDGAYDVDLETATPVAGSSENGFWDYVLPSDWRGKGTIEPSSTPGAAHYHMFTDRFDLVHFIAEEQILGTGRHDFEPQNINASLVLPEWRFQCTLHNEGGGHHVQFVWRVLASRYWTTV